MLESESEWVLIPKSDPDRSKVSSDKHFRRKNIAAQQKVNDELYPEYREVKTLEVMTMAVLYDLSHKEKSLPDYYLRCEEGHGFCGRVCVGYFRANGLRVRGVPDFNELDFFGRALSGKS